MLSKYNIDRELGKGICIVPFHPTNFKENSINLTISRNAWTLGEGRYYVINRETIVPLKPGENAPKGMQVFSLGRGDSAISNGTNKKQLIMLPHTTTIIETSEVIGVDNRIGGTLHSKVGMVAKGIGHIGTMLGPCYCGHLMISLHNITDEIVCIPVGDTFVSLAFYYLDHPVETKQNSNISGHIDKLAAMGIHVDAKTTEYLTQSWKIQLDGIRGKMKEEKNFTEYQQKKKVERRKHWLQYINVRNGIIVILMVAVIVGLFFLAQYLDSKATQPSTAWIDRYWTLICSGVLLPLILKLPSLFKKND